MHSLTLAIAFLFAAYVCPSPYTLEAPGPVFQASRLVQIQGHAALQESGQLLLPTVVSQPATLLMAIYALTHPDVDLHPRTQISQGMGPLLAQSGSGDEGEVQMGWSQLLAIENAFQLLSTRNPQFQAGLGVVAVDPSGPNAQRFQPGDVLTELQGRSLSRAWQLTFALNSQKSTQVKLKLFRKGQPQTTLALVWNRPQRRVLGLRLEPVLLLHGRPIRAQIDAQQVVGASGGLVFALEIVRQMSSQGWLHQRKIAVTGTLDRDGRVGPIEGIAYKRLAAEKAGAEMLLCPIENAAQCSPQGLPVRGVATIQEALTFLAQP